MGGDSHEDGEENGDVGIKDVCGCGGEGKGEEGGAKGSDRARSMNEGDAWEQFLGMAMALAGTLFDGQREAERLASRPSYSAH